MSAERSIEEFWDTHPCGAQLVDELRGDYDGYFRKYDELRYSLEGHILECLDRLNVDGEDVLEIGLGQGADSEQLIRRGARWSGVDLTQESVDRVRTRLALRELAFRDIKKGSVLQLPFPDASFSLVYSHGVLHHVPDIHRAQQEIARVLRPGGRLVVMLYAKHSVNYHLSIRVLRRLGLAAMYLSRMHGRGIYAEHLERARQQGLRRYLSMREFIHRNTDGPGNPYSKVYSKSDIIRDFPQFRVVLMHKEFMHAPPLPVHRLPGSRWFGWHLWAHMVRR
jgi:ubiquinone/menaquinone biosynthesis C-methylase UbiE